MHGLTGVHFDDWNPITECVQAHVSINADKQQEMTWLE